MGSKKYQWQHTQPRLDVARPELPDGRRLLRIYKVVEVMEDLFESKAQEVQDYKRRWTSRGETFWRKRELEARRQGQSLHMKMVACASEVMRWMPHILSEDSLWPEPLDPEELAELFRVFTPATAKALRPALEKGLNEALPKANLSSITPVLQGMAIAGLPHAPAWTIVGQSAIRRCAGASTGTISEFAWALAEAKEKARPECFEALLVGLREQSDAVPASQLRILAWSCAEIGLELPSVLGQTSIMVEPSQVRIVREALSRLALGPGGSQLHAEPTPVVAVEDAISPEAAASLLRLADEGGLWRPSARRGSEALPGRPWSAALDRLEHRFSPTANAVRLWVADALGVPSEHVEALRLLRYREGETSGPPHMDARPQGDASLWLSGQRIATVLIHLGDLPEDAGGEVEFPELESLRVRPRAGVALLWPTTDYDGRPEPRFARAALPVVGEGLVRYAAATWVRSGPAPGQDGGVP